MRWQGLAWGAPLAAALLALLELTRLPSAVLGHDAPRAIAALAELVESALTEFAIPGALLLVAAALSFWTERTEGRRAKLGLAARFGVGVAQAALAREVLIAYPPFAWSWIANALFVVIGLALGAALAWLGTRALERHRRATTTFGATLALSALIGARAHYAVYVGLYPTLHSALLQLAFVALAVGIALALAPIARPALPRRVALAFAIPLGVTAVLDLPAAAAARPYVVAYTELGRAAGVSRALAREGDALSPRALPPARTDATWRPDPDAAQRFARHSGLPALPSTFDLADYDVLFILSDATRYDRTSLARADGPTPHLAELAEGAWTFERAYSPSNGTFPSVASILAMTPVSLAELDVRPRFWRGRLREERTTAAEAMRESGRATFWIGHDHRGCFSDNIEGLEQGFDTRALERDAIDADERIAIRASETIRAHRGQRYFGLVFFGSPHDEYLAHDPSLPSETDLDRYDQELSFMDRALGRLLDALREDGALDHTIVIFAGDHGEAFGEHGNHFHLSSMYDEQIHVPLVVRAGNVPGERVAAPTSTAYVFPWLLSRGGEAERAAADRVLSEDVGPLMRALDGAVLSEMIGPHMQEAALVYRDHVLVYDVLADLLRVYDARLDPTEEHDLREDRPDLLGHFVPLARRYRRARFTGRRFRFIEASP